MDEWMDRAWEAILAFFMGVAAGLDRMLAPLNQLLGPALVILLLTIAVVALTKLLHRLYQTRRHEELKANYEHWYNLRQAAMASEDREKGRILARNIDQAQLNKAYYDYFFEGFLKSIATTILPVLFLAAYINHAYAPARLKALTGQAHIFLFERTEDAPVAISGFFWLVICLVLVHLTWWLVKMVLKKGLTAQP